MKKSKLLLAFGILTCSISQIISRYLNTDDSIKGLIMGFGIGLLIIGILQLKRTSKI
ncbi:hypothetical protein FIA58_005525 [Flavobacterium jejuense]|uniref:Uncharacterized protein n=1 Tax=Flavobacterium jejuense TaxID=1544455 RepID=A0ABX0IPY2_9FLAO|nr:hypothetical protein [Flavobacterium jejuense]NHN25135.1 hypothetical protein [Flavobacterium jejuense]